MGSGAIGFHHEYQVRVNLPDDVYHPVGAIGNVISAVQNVPGHHLQRLCIGLRPGIGFHK